MLDILEKAMNKKFMIAISRSAHMKGGVQYNKIESNENVSICLYSVDSAQNPFVYVGKTMVNGARDFINFNVNRNVMSANGIYYKVNQESKAFYGRRK